LSEQAGVPRGAARTERDELGFEPPLDLRGRSHALADRRKVNVRWLVATALTGVFGAGLMAVAVISAHDREVTVGKRPQMAQTQRVPQPASDRPLSTARKGDKLVRSADLSSARHSFRTPTTIRAQGRNVIKVRNFTMLATPLLLTGGAFAEDIPHFDPLKLLTEGSDRGVEIQPPPVGDDPDAEVSLVMVDVAALNAPLADATLSEAEVEAQVREVGATPRRQVPAMPAQMLLARTLQTPRGVTPAYAPLVSAPFGGLDVRMVDENVTIMPKVDTTTGGADLVDERVATAKRGETLEALLRANGATVTAARQASAALRDRALAEGQRVAMLFASYDGPGTPRQLARITLHGDNRIEAMAAINDRNQFVAAVVEPAQPQRRASTDDDDDDETSTNLALHASLYETALKNDIPRPIVDEMVRIFSSDSDTDFQRRVSGGDQIELFFSDDDDGREVLFASLTTGSETRRYYRFVNPDDNSVDYFDENGRSARKFLLRKPVVNAQMRSGFGMRRHPILGYSKMHTGVDWANGSSGEPIIAAGSGVVIKAGWDTGYGRRVEIQHANGYVTTYSHMSAFGRNIAIGSRVRQGQVIGYIGSSGLSTGPHLHYEVIVNDNFVDPMRIKVPRSRELDGRMLAEFRAERDRVDELRKRSPARQRVGELTAR
jgi:murein DD-endopeptidase MepM/ murein hydrolase activator NlpD